MTFRQYLTLMALSTAGALMAWLIVVLAIDPINTGAPTKIVFYLTFFIASVGLLSIGGALIRVLVIHKDAVVSRQVAHAFRQSLLFSSIILISLFMASVNYLRWWTMILIVLLFAGIELFLLTAGRRHL
ncbi:MAG: hypothetical protein AAB429_01985 [Patescibacteria group bacterium]